MKEAFQLLYKRFLCQFCQNLIVWIHMEQISNQACFVQEKRARIHAKATAVVRFGDRKNLYDKI